MPPEEVNDGPPAPFEIEDRIGTKEVRLTGSFGRSEVTVIVDADPEQMYYQARGGAFPSLPFCLIRRLV